ncbi:type II toxin-antitoxin system VapC family toxin [Ramlibacter albus]|uniref:Ribonuclease VapC n=1 Tax=Ramlibacter albus TaxID=2079448 RepID=A0A923S267_9BURK|nr:type II toxin-antitoxin system VapC family toxin [Ramlibacter albus]MBC5764438.1 type II toxin-antitoxin system VapC family toxin [Ramlibacter albus]
MKPVALDTNAYVAFKRGEEAVLEVLRRAGEILLSTTVLGELLAGFAAGTRESRNRLELAEFSVSPRVRIVHATEATADNYALVYAALRRKGKPVPTNDLWIAASALEHGAALLTFDAHFAAIDGLRSGRQLADFLP